MAPPRRRQAAKIRVDGAIPETKRLLSRSSGERVAWHRRRPRKLRPACPCRTSLSPRRIDVPGSPAKGSPGQPGRRAATTESKAAWIGPPQSPCRFHRIDTHRRYPDSRATKPSPGNWEHELGWLQPRDRCCDGSWPRPAGADASWRRRNCSTPGTGASIDRSPGFERHRRPCIRRRLEGIRNRRRHGRHVHRIARGAQRDARRRQRRARDTARACASLPIGSEPG